MPIRVAINGFGRIGRQITRLLSSQHNNTLQLAAINTLEDCETIVHLLRFDSIQGVNEAQIYSSANKLFINNTKIPVYHESVPHDIPWNVDNIDVVIECSGRFTNGRQAAAHLNSGAKKVVISAASEDPDVTICMGVNQPSYDPASHKIISGSSCTTNCLAPLAKVINDNFGIVTGFATFIHSSTNSQHLLDSVDSDPRRARAAGINLIPTTTSAAQQIPLVIPSLINKFDALAIRVPTPDVHLADFTIRLNQKITKADLLKTLEIAAQGEMRRILQVSQEPLVSIDFRNSSHSCVIDATQIKVNHDMIKILVWHANEFSYCQRLIDLVNFI